MDKPLELQLSQYTTPPKKDTQFFKKDFFFKVIFNKISVQIFAIVVTNKTFEI